MIKKRFLSMLVLLCLTVSGAWAQEAQTITINPDFLTLDAEMHEGDDFLPITYENIPVENAQSFGLQFYTAEGEETEKPTWFFAQVTRPNNGDTYQVNVATYPNDGEARSAYFKVYALETLVLEDNPARVYSNLVTVTQEGIPVAVTGVTLSPTTATLTVGETVTLTATVAPEGATDKSVTWSSSNTSVATVSNEGEVTAVAAGEATITVTTTDGAKTATCAVTVAAPAAYTVSLKEGTDDATSWKGKAGEAAYQDLPLESVAAGTAVTVKYDGTKKVKSVKAKKKAAAAAAATVTTAPTAKTGVKAGEDVAIVNEGAAEGGTMMYMVNATQPASTEGFSATVPTAEGLTAGTYYVWYYVKADDSHTDSEISASGIEVTIAAQKITVADLDKDEGDFWEDIIQKNSDKIYADDGKIKRTSDNAILMVSDDGGDSWNPVSSNSYDVYDPEDMTYKFEGDD